MVGVSYSVDAGFEACTAMCIDILVAIKQPR